MDDEKFKIERWSVCERYKNYKSNNYYKEPLQFRPHPENIVRDVIMYHIYHNEGKLLNGDLIRYIKNKIIKDLDVIFMLYQYAPDAISTINRLMSSKSHLGSKETYNEMIFHALTIEDVREVLIEQILNILIKYIPEQLGNVRFDAIMKDDVKDLVDNINKTHNQLTKNNKGESVMKGNPKNIEVGDVVRFTSVGEPVTSVVLSIWDQGYTHSGDEDSIDGYLVRATVMCKGNTYNFPVKNLTIVRKWHGFTPITSEHVKQEEVKVQHTYSFEMSTDKSFETLELAVGLIEGLTSADIVEVDPDKRLVVVNQNLVDKLCEFVNTRSRLIDYDVEFDGYGFWWNGHERLDLQHFLDDYVECAIVEELKRKALSNKLHVTEVTK